MIAIGGVKTGGSEIHETFTTLVPLCGYAQVPTLEQNIAIQLLR